MSTGGPAPRVSVVIPVFDEEESLELPESELDEDDFDEEREPWSFL